MLVLIDEEGLVERVRLADGVPVTRFSTQVLLAATNFRFQPATVGGQPVRVEISYRHTFVPPAPPVVDPAEACRGTLRGEVVERGTGKPIADAVLAVHADGRVWGTRTDEAGGFVLDVPAGRSRVEVRSLEHERFLVFEVLANREELEVRYLVERTSYDPYQTVVVAQAERDVVARTSLRDKEIRQVPGSFGDPFRVVNALPGVTSPMSLLSYAIVRGSSPGNTGTLIDGVEIPQLFHLLAGPAVVHPAFIEGIDFYPGSFPVRFGEYVGGLVHGTTRRPRMDEARIEANADLTRAGVFVQLPIEPLALTTRGAFQYGYPGALLGALIPNATLGYLDYQLRVDGGVPGSRFKAFLFGSEDVIASEDETGRETVQLGTTFHRLDLTYERALDGRTVTGQVLLGYDASTLGDGLEISDWMGKASARWEEALSGALKLEVGVDGSWRDAIWEPLLGDVPPVELTTQFGSAAAYASLTWEPLDGLFLVPGVRADGYRSAPGQAFLEIVGDDSPIKRADQLGVDPRLLVRWRAATSEAGDWWLKAGVGLYHQPPRFFIPVPAINGLGLAEGLLETFQTNLGVEAPVGRDALLDAQLYFQLTDPILLDFETNADPLSLEGGGLLEDPFALVPSKGRGYGLEVLLKKRAAGRLFGWAAYTLAFAERWKETPEGPRWLAYDYDVRHSLNLVAGVSLPDRWEVGLRVQLNTGRPVHTLAGGANSGRMPPFARLDLRVDKHVLYDDWILDFYVDITNANYARESLGTLSESFRYVLPTFGLRAVL